MVTGGSGFIGGALCRYFQELDIPFRLLSRDTYSILCKASLLESSHSDKVVKHRLLVEGLSDCETVIHLAAKAHDTKVVSGKNFEFMLAEFRRVNVNGTLNFAKICAQAGIKRFIYVSSIKVNGESTLLNSPFGRESIPNPTDPYGISKFEAESVLL